MIMPILTYQSTVKVTFTKTQKERLKSLQRRASVIFGREAPSVRGHIYTHIATRNVHWTFVGTSQS